MLKKMLIRHMSSPSTTNGIKRGPALPWDHARDAVHAAWAKVSHHIGPRKPVRGNPQRILGPEKSMSERPLIGGMNLVIRDNEDHLADLVLAG